MTRLLGLDVGTSSVKGIAIDEDGAVLAVAERGYPLSTPRPGWSEQDPEDWWRGAAEVLEELNAANAAGIGLSGQMHGLVALDAGGRPLRPAILWNDGRTQAQCEEIEERIGFDRLVQLTGNRALAGPCRGRIGVRAGHDLDGLDANAAGGRRDRAGPGLSAGRREPVAGADRRRVGTGNRFSPSGG